MKNKPSAAKPLDTWQEETRISLAAKEKAKIQEEDRRKQAALEYDLYDYAVFKDGKEQHRTKHIQEALNLAKSINGKVWWLIEGVAVSPISNNQSHGKDKP